MGRDRKNETRRTGMHFAQMMRSMMDTPAWRALPPYAQALYPFLRLEWRGPKHNNNGRLRLSVRQAAAAMGVSRTTAAKAFHELQAKGFILLRQHAHLGTEGAARTAEYEMTDIPMPGSADRDGQHLYRDWREGADFPVHRSPAHNPRGINGTRRPAPKVVRLSRKDAS